MARRSDHSKEELRSMILDAAQRNLVQAGYAGLTARKIASDIDYTVGTLYHNFQNLDDIVLHVNARTLDDLYDALRAACERHREAQQRVMAIGRTYIDFAFKNRNRWSAVYDIPVRKETPVPDWYRARVTRNLEYVAIQLAPLVPEINPQQLRKSAYMIWCSVHGMCVLSVGHKLEVPRAELGVLAENFIKDYIAGLVIRDREKTRVVKREAYVQ
ncbi:MAG: TetR/AcrR family transcriptional regulator [Pseudomonadota bacterium]